MKLNIGDRVKIKDSITLQNLQNCGSIAKKGIGYIVIDISTEAPPMYKLKGANYLPGSYLDKVITYPKW
jgi:hypothetical protein